MKSVGIPNLHRRRGDDREREWSTSRRSFAISPTGATAVVHRFTQFFQKCIPLRPILR